jgi:hypothetical protein
MTDECNEVNICNECMEKMVEDFDRIMDEIWKDEQSGEMFCGGSIKAILILSDDGYSYYPSQMNPIDSIAELKGRLKIAAKRITRKWKR